MVQVNQLEYHDAVKDIDAFEIRSSRPVGGESAELHFVVDGTASEVDARRVAEAALVDWGKLTFDGKPLAGVTVRPDYIDPENQDDLGRWSVVASYSRRAFTCPAMVDPVTQAKSQAIDFDISGERRHITQSLATLWKSVPKGKEQIDFHGAIRVKSNGKHPVVEGTDIVVSHESFSLAKTVPTSLLTAARRKQLKAMVGKVNDKVFTITLNEEPTEYAWGELRFMGVTGRIVEGLDRTDLVFKFESNETQFKVPVGDSIVVPRVGGFELLWVSYAIKEDADTMSVTPRQANVEQVCGEIDFAPLTALGIK